ncbi:MAG: rod shape-determining protein [Candidatus Dormibacteria bacterium]
MLGKKLGIDLGTATVRLVVKGEGLVAGEPSVVAMGADGDWSGVFGTAALEAAALAPQQRLYRPVMGGAVVDPVAARALINHVVSRAVGRQRIFKPDVVIAVMAGLPGDQRRTLLEAAMLAGARTAYLLNTTIASAMGCGMRLSGSNGHCVIDIGAGKSDIAVLALESTVAGRTLADHGGQRLHACIAEHLSTAHGITVEASTIEELIASLARVGSHEERRLSLRGRRGNTDHEVTITSTELGPCLDAHVRGIAAALDAVLSDTPATLLQDVRTEGIVLCGGGARLEGLDRALQASSGIDVHVDAEPHLCTVKGTGYALDNLDVLKRNFMYIR